MYAVNLHLFSPAFEFTHTKIVSTKDAGRLDFEVAAWPRLMKFQKNWNSKKIHIKFQIVGMLAKGIYSKYIICNLNTDILVVFLIPKK